MGSVATKISFEEFLELPKKPGVKYERWDGEVVEVLGRAEPKHEILKGRAERAVGELLFKRPGPPN